MSASGYHFHIEILDKTSDRKTKEALEDKPLELPALQGIFFFSPIAAQQTGEPLHDGFYISCYVGNWQNQDQNYLLGLHPLLAADHGGLAWEAVRGTLGIWEWLNQAKHSEL